MKRTHTRLAAAGAIVMGLLGTAPNVTAQGLSPADQNALLRTHCLPCHSDAMPLGALSVEHLDVARAPGSLVAMLLSQISQHLPLATVQSSHREAPARAAVATRVRRGAMTAAGLRLPPDETLHALIDALAARSIDARAWNVERGRASGAATGTVGHGGTITVSTIREVLTDDERPVPIYRFSATCNESTGVGEFRLSWLPFPVAGTITMSVDDGPSIAVTVDTATTSVALATVSAGSRTRISIPQRRMVVAVPQGDTVEFPFMSLPVDASRALSSCF